MHFDFVYINKMRIHKEQAKNKEPLYLHATVSFFGWALRMVYEEMGFFIVVGGGSHLVCVVDVCGLVVR